MGLPDQNSDTDEPLQVGLILNSQMVPAWAAQLLRDLQSADFARIASVRFQQDSSSASRGDFRNWLFNRYMEWDKRRITLPDDPLEPTDISELLAALGIPGDQPRLDLMIAIDCELPAEMASSSSGCEIWTIRHCDPDQYSGVPPYFWELYDANPVSGTAVEAFRPGQDSRAILYKAFSATEQGWSLRQNAAVPYWRASSAILSCLGRFRRSQDMPEKREIAQPTALPSNGQMLKFLAQNVFRTVTRRIRYKNEELYWFVAYRTDKSKFVANSGRFEPEGFQEITAPPGSFYADPFVLRSQGESHIFVEDYSYTTKKGRITVLKPDSAGHIVSAQPVLERPYHLSYPFVFEHDGGLYMIPETLDARRIELYRATQAAGPWEYAKTLKDGVCAVDTTLWVENGLFYFFTNIAGRGVTMNDDLFLFWSENLLGDWRPHPHNPICADVRRSRSAGKLFRTHGKLIRPAQDCSIRYGYACQLNEIEVLSPSEYRERPMTRIEPNWHPALLGTHTINSDETIEVIDGQVSRKKPRFSA